MNTKGNPKFLRWFNFFSYFIFSSPILVLFFNSVLDNYALSMTIYAAQSISCSLLEIPFGIISDRIERKNIMVLGAITRLLCFVIWAMSYSFVPLLLGAIIGGASDATGHHIKHFAIDDCVGAVFGYCRTKMQSSTRNIIHQAIYCSDKEPVAEPPVKICYRRGRIELRIK